MLNPFRKITTAMRLDKQITLTEESLISNVHNGAHYAAMAEGNRKQLVALRAMKALEESDSIVTVRATTKALAKESAAVKGSAPRLASSK